MRLNHYIALGAALAGSVGLAVSADAKPNNRRSPNARARAVLVRAADAPDDDAKGRIDISTKKNDRSEMRVMAQRLTPGLVVDFVIVGDSGDEVIGDDVTVDDEGGAHVFLRTKKGDTLPLGAATAADLQGRRIVVRDNAAQPADLLVGNVPSLNATFPRRLRLREQLVNEAPGTNPDARGMAKITWRARDMRSGLDMKVKGLGEGDLVSFRIADGGGTVTEVGTATADDEGTARYRVRSKHGDPLPHGAATVLDLGARAIEVHVTPVGGASALQLSGVVPSAP